MVPRQPRPGTYPAPCPRLGQWHFAGVVFDEGCALLRHPRQVVPREALLDAAWPEEAVCDDNVTQRIVEIRRALGERAG